MQTVKLKDFKSMCLDIIENDDDKDYGYSEIYDTEDDFGNCVYGCAVYKRRLPLVAASDYRDAVEMLREYGDEGLTKCHNIIDAINAHMDWWLQQPMTPEEADNLDVYIGEYTEITELLNKGFTGPRLLYAHTNWQV